MIKRPSLARPPSLPIASCASRVPCGAGLQPSLQAALQLLPDSAFALSPGHHEEVPQSAGGAPWTEVSRAGSPPLRDGRNTFDEDHQTVRGSAAQGMAILRNLAISYLRLAGHHSIASSLRWVARSPMRALALIGA